MEFLNTLKAGIPDYAKDIRLNLDSVIARSSLDAAEAAGISRATAYRYFPTQDMLLAEVALFAAGGPLFPQTVGDEPIPEAVGRLVRRVGVWAYANEKPLRTLLRLSLDPSTGVRRPGHRREWIGEALAPVRKQMDANTYEHLSNALTLMMGIDPVEQRRMMQESLQAILALFRAAPEQRISMQSDWFTLRVAQLHIRPYTWPYPEIAMITKSLQPSSSRARLATSKPSIPGKPMSRSRTSGR